MDATAWLCAAVHKLVSGLPMLVGWFEVEHLVGGKSGREVETMDVNE